MPMPVSDANRIPSPYCMRPLERISRNGLMRLLPGSKRFACKICDRNFFRFLFVVW